ncbi:hypothetical protein HPB47_012453 [Ixodes persulcatus]|uniref:Uncharacterized protein n=1 Tax=Ixodes persulcatus TaxID=34615 RepID=A0AC60NTH4_IXOPE|nr:hypothetical protein HPB47_012453 [Ixodes persulcatus]
MFATATRRGGLCDGVLRTLDGGVFWVHRVMLCSLSPFFTVLYTNPMVREPPWDVMLRGVSAAMLEQLIRFCYTKQIHVTNANVEQLLEVADMFLVEDLVQLCCSHLRRELSIGNSMGMYRVADHYYCPQFREKVIQYVCEHFSEITRQSEEFIHTPYEYLRSLLSMDELNVRNENYLLDVLRRWVDYNPTVRSSFLSSLFQGVRVGFCSPENLRSFVYSYPFMAQQSSCRQALYSLSQGGCCSWGRDGGPEGAMVAAGSACGHCGTWRPRMPSELMLVVGGWAETRATSVMEAYDVRANKWLICLDEDIMPRAYHGLVVLGDLLYMVGGFDGDTCFSSMQCYDLKRHVWLERSCMNLARCYVSVSTLGGHIYAAGGFTGNALAP